jgi:hypothetical protein
MADGFEAYDQWRGNGQLPALWIDDDSWVEADLPRRPWVAPRYALRGSVTVIAGPPSAMKSSLMLAWAIAVALRQPHGKFRPTGEGGVVVYDTEDDQTEQRRRLSSALRQFDATPKDISNKIIRTGPANGLGVLFARDEQTRQLHSTPAMAALREILVERRPVLLIADPLAELHAEDENDNIALRAVIAEFRSLAAEFNLAVILVHHTRKGAVTPGDPDVARGASAIIGAARIVLTLATMSEQDAESFGMPTDRKNREAYVRLDDAKQNYADIGDAVWYEKATYKLDNDELVVAAVPWKSPELWDGISSAKANRILDDIEAGIDGGKHRYSDASAATFRAAWQVVQRHIPTFNERQARKIIHTWIQNGSLFREQYRDDSTRKNVVGLYVNNAKRPS